MGHPPYIALATALILSLSGVERVAAQPASGSLSSLRIDEAVFAMSRGDYVYARDLCLIVLVSDDENFRAHREAGRAFFALGRLERAAHHLARAIALQGDVRDAEAHYLLGEAYYALNRAADGKREHDVVREQIAADTSDRMERLWLARIHARRGELTLANAIYQRLLAADPFDLEASIARIEAHTLARRWATAEKLLREVVANHPEYPRAKDILAWVLEAQNKTDEERALRTSLAEDPDGQRLVDHARVLERQGEYEAAIRRYRQALDDDSVDEFAVRSAVDRLSRRLSPETAVLAGVDSDPLGSLTRLAAGVAVPVTDYASMTLRLTMEDADGVMLPGSRMQDVRIGTIDASLVSGAGQRVAGALTVSGSYFAFDDEADSTARLGSGVDVRVGQGLPVQVHGQADLGMPWREAASTIRQGGRETGAIVHLYALPLGHDLIVDVGGRLRGMELTAASMDEQATGSQKMLFGGLDWVAWSDPTRVARGEILDENLRWTTYMADALVLSYRHYEAKSEDNFGDALVLAERNSIDEVSTVGRKTLIDGVVAAEARAGFGHDWARSVRLWRGGGSLLLTLLDRARGSIAYDYSKESTSGFVGVRHTGWISLHVDL